MKRALFVTDPAHFDAAVPGGVQLCSRDYVALLQECGLEVDVHRVAHTRSIATRILIRAGLEVYRRYDFVAELPRLEARIRELGADVVALNQVALMGFAPLLRERWGNRIRIVLLSHGNESGDFLHDLIRRRRNPLARLRDTYRLGALLRREAEVFSASVDALLTISENDLRIGQWLGANRAIFVPRSLNPDFLDWCPVQGRVGFVASLDHLPNVAGLRAVLDELKAQGDSAVKVRLVGGPRAAGEALARAYSSIEYLGPLDDAALREEARTWCAFLNPVLWFARGASTKLAVAIAWGIPVISTPAGNRGYVWTQGQLSTADSPHGMAELARTLALDSAIRAKAADAVRAVASSSPALADLARQVSSTRLFEPAH